jgi:hypothetical protein
MFVRAGTRVALAVLAWATVTYGVLYCVELFVIKQHALGASVAGVAVDQGLWFVAAAAMVGVGVALATDRLWRRVRKGGPALPRS